MVEFGAKRNISLYREKQRRREPNGTPLRDEHCRALYGHWGNFHSVIVGGRPCVIKIINLPKLWKKDATLAENPYTEIDYHRILNSINPIFFPDFIDILVENNYAYYFMEEGKCVFDHVTDWQNGVYGNIKAQEIFEKFENEAKLIFKHCLQALDFMHSLGYAHSDVKLENMIISEDEHGNLRGKLIDLGSTKKYDRACEEQFDFNVHTLMHSGTDFNMSPERRFHSRPYEAERFRIQLTNPSRFNAAKDDLWSWAFGILQFIVGGPIWTLKNPHAKRIKDRPTQTDYAFFALGTKGSYMTDKTINTEWFNKCDLTLRELLKRRGCKNSFSFLSETCIEMLEKIFVPEDARPGIAMFLEDDWL